jgi:hypothetical protein
MDFKAISATLKMSTKVEIIHPITGEGGWFIELATPCNARAQAAARDILDKSQELKFPTRAQKDRSNAEFLAALTLGWTGLTDNGEEVPFSPEACIQMYLDPNAFWVVGPVNKALGDPSRPFSV